MGKKKQIILFVLIFGLVAFVSAMNFPAFSSGKQSWDNLKIFTYGDSIKVFDTKTGMFYKYNDNNGKILKVWQLDELGKDLKKVRPIK
jgi:hypothetical protein